MIRTRNFRAGNNWRELPGVRAGADALAARGARRTASPGALWLAPPLARLLSSCSRVRMPWKSLGLALAVGCGAGCGAPKEAVDPRAFLDDEGGLEQPEDEEAAEAEPPGSSSRPAGARTPAPAGRPAPDPDREAATRSATRQQCRAASENLERRGIEAAVTAATLEARRRLVDGELKRAEAQARIERATAECLARGTSEAEASCIARVRVEADIDRCVR
jgi:hypothetical protein